ncbi:transcriptional regulator [Paraburkholderia sp. MM5482-R1]|uniref:transcriptional regulator n=1 Tax=unclassified Paraburkholderia TaxID=2615204 RepID=UPI003D1B2077
MESDQPRISQQDFLLAAMTQCSLSRYEFAALISVGRSTLDKWLLPDDSADFRALSGRERAYIAQVVRSK